MLFQPFGKIQQRVGSSCSKAGFLHLGVIDIWRRPARMKDPGLLPLDASVPPERSPDIATCPLRGSPGREPLL